MYGKCHLIILSLVLIYMLGVDSINEEALEKKYVVFTIYKSTNVWWISKIYCYIFLVQEKSENIYVIISKLPSKTKYHQRKISYI